MKKYLLLFIAVLVLGAGSYFSERQFLSYAHPPASATSTKQTSIDFTLSAGGKTYSGTVRDGATVMNAMQTLASSTNFRFITKDFPGMGAFVESINGTANASGRYWILYVNGVSSQTGASQTPVHENDSLEWRYESR